MIDICHQMNMNGQQISTLLAVIFTMLAFSKVGKKHREETAYTAVVGVSLLCLASIFLAGPIGHIIDAVHSSNAFINALAQGAIAAIIITALIMVIGKMLKVKTMAPKTLALCFFIGVTVANLVVTAIGNQCSTPSKSAKHHG